VHVYVLKRQKNTVQLLARYFCAFSTNNFKVGQNLNSTRLAIVNGLFNLDWLGESFKTHKVKSKKPLHP
jgi:hypothetical protein